MNTRLGIVATEGDIRDIQRLNKNPTQNRDRPAPILMTVKDIQLKESIFRNAKKLSGDKSISFRYDQTPLEREEYRKQVELAKEKSKNDPGAIYRVRGPPWDRKLV